MGCDIHAYVEVKISAGKWRLYSQPRIQRNYALFSKICRVRESDERPIMPILNEPNGLPDNLSDVVLIEAEYDNDMHSAGWLNKDQLEELLCWANNPKNKVSSYQCEFEHTQFGYCLGNGLTEIGEEDSSLPKEYRDVRLVFWFDN